MKLDKEEVELLDLVDKNNHFEKIDNYEQTIIEAKIMAKQYLNKTKK